MGKKLFLNLFFLKNYTSLIIKYIHYTYTGNKLCVCCQCPLDSIIFSPFRSSHHLYELNLFPQLALDKVRAESLGSHCGKGIEKSGQLH